MIIEGNRSHLYQWNAGQRLKLLTDPAGTILSLSTGGDALRREAYYDNGLVYADIPNLLLQQAGRLYVYVHRVAGDRMTTVLEATYQIRAQPKPPDYINDDPAEILIWHQVEQAVRDDAADAAKSAGAASKSAEAAVESQRLAATSAQDAKTAAQTASEAAGRAETAQKSIVGTEGRVNATAKQVSADALTAQTARDDALTHRQAAEGALGEAQASAVRAENAALDADQSETAAKTAAQNAAGSAQSAAESQRLAGVSEQNAAAYATQTAEDRTQTGLDRAAVDSAATDIAQSIDGVAQDITARRLLDQQAQTNRLLSTLKPDDGSTSALNGFALSLGKNREVILTYTDPVSGDVYAPATIPTDDTAAELAAEQRLLNGWVADIAKMMEEDECGT